MSGTDSIEYHRTALLSVVIGLFVLAGFTADGTPVARVSKRIRAQILRVLRPAETATRRLVLYLSNRIALPNASERTAHTSVKGKRQKPAQTRAPVFRLFDRWKYFPELADSRRRINRGRGPRILLFDGFDHLRYPARPETPERDPEDAARLCRRMEALHHALSKMPAQALRLKRAMARREKAPPGPGCYGPMRPGPPPGSRTHRSHEVDELLWVCHAMAWRDAPPYDTS